MSEGMSEEKEGRGFAYASADGLALYGRQWGPEDAAGLPLVCLPGFTRSWRDFAALAETLAARGRRVIALDLRGRGGSAFGPSSSYRPPQEAKDVMAGMDHLGLERAHFIGTSRGGIVTMLIAMMAPGRVASAILNDIGPALQREGFVRIAAQMRQTPPASWDEAVAELVATQGTLFPRIGEAGFARFARQLYDDDAGVPRLPYDPALADGFRGLVENPKLPELWAGLDALKGGPVLVLRGALSDVLSAEIAARMAERHDRLTLVEVPDEGHAPLLWDTPTQEAVAAFLDGAEAA